MVRPVLVLFIGLVFAFITASAVQPVPMEVPATAATADIIASEDGEEEAMISVAERAEAADLDEDESDEESESESDSESEEEEESDSDESDIELVELDMSFGPFQAAANVMPYNVATDPGHHFMNPFIRGYNPAYDGYTPQPGGAQFNNPNGPYWSPFHWSAPSSYWSVYPPQYASNYVNPGMYHAPGMHQFLGPNYYGGHHGHAHGPNAAFPYGSQDPHVYGPHLDWPFGALTSDMDHVPGFGVFNNPKAAFPQFIESESESSSEAEAAAEEEEERAPSRSECVNCAYAESDA